MSDQLTATEARELAVQLLICARETEEHADRSEAPGWIVWERATDGGRPHIRAIDLSEQKAEAHVEYLKAAARMQQPPKPEPDLLIEETRLDHLYAAALLKALQRRQVGRHEDRRRRHVVSDDRDERLKRHVARCPIGWHKGQLSLHRATTDADVIAWLQGLDRLVGVRQDGAIETRLPKPPLPEDEAR